MYEIDFLPIEKSGEQGSKSGDAITVRFTEERSGRTRVLVIDAGFAYKGEDVVKHVQRHYGTSHVDLLISTHPDQDHINGLATVLEELSVGEVFIHRPHNHVSSASDLANIEVVDAIIGLAEDRDVPVVEPFTGVTRFGEQVRILGPSETYYKQLLLEQLEEVRSGTAQSRLIHAKIATILSMGNDLLKRAISYLPTVETLGEDGETSPRNNSSVVTMLTVDNEHMIFTGDAGIPALTAAWDAYEDEVSAVPIGGLDFFQAPHHGSRRNLSPSLLNRIFGTPGERLNQTTSFISSAANDPKHPSPKVTNALKRRSVNPYATEGQSLLHCSNPGLRSGWGPIAPIEPLDESDD